MLLCQHKPVINHNACSYHHASPRWRISVAGDAALRMVRRGARQRNVPWRSLRIFFGAGRHGEKHAIRQAGVNMPTGCHTFLTYHTLFLMTHGCCACSMPLRCKGRAGGRYEGQAVSRNIALSATLASYRDNVGLVGDARHATYCLLHLCSLPRDNII